jgi:hypothetical protein
MGVVFNAKVREQSDFVVPVFKKWYEVDHVCLSYHICHAILLSIPEDSTRDVVMLYNSLHKITKGLQSQLEKGLNNTLLDRTGPWFFVAFRVPEGAICTITPDVSRCIYVKIQYGNIAG